MEIGTSLPQHDPEEGKGLGNTNTSKQRQGTAERGKPGEPPAAKGQRFVTTVTCQLHLGTGEGLGSSCWEVTEPTLGVGALLHQSGAVGPFLPNKGKSWWWLGMWP